jgi:hypothetical protein
MAETRKTSRRTCRRSDSTIILSPKSPRKANSMVDTPRRVRLLADAHSTIGKMTRKKLFKLHNIVEAIGYQILKSKEARRSERIHDRGWKPVLAPYERDAIKTIENALFRFRIATYFANINVLGLANGSKRVIQRNMAEYSIRTYMATQKKFIVKALIEKRGIWAFMRRY